MKTHRISELNLSAPEGIVVVMNFPVLGRHEILLSEAATYLRTTQGMVGRMPTSVHLTDGRKVGAFPCIIAKTPEAAKAMSTMVGYDIAVGDGVSSATQLQARERYEALTTRFSVPPKHLRRKWMVSPPEPVYAAPKPSAYTQEQRDAALNDSPF